MDLEINYYKISPWFSSQGISRFRLFLEQEHSEVKVKETHAVSAKLQMMLGQVTPSWGPEGVDCKGREPTDDTAGKLVSTAPARVKRWGLLIQGHTGRIFQLESYSELRSLGISSVSQTAVIEGVWNDSILKTVTDLATTEQQQTFAQGFLVAVGKYASDHLTVETELYRQVTVLLPDGGSPYTSSFSSPFCI